MGVMIMKMISSTSSTSMRGVTFISAAGRPLEFIPKLIVSPQHIGHQSGGTSSRSGEISPWGSLLAGGSCCSGGLFQQIVDFLGHADLVLFPRCPIFDAYGFSV